MALLPVEQALAQIIAGVRPLATEAVPLGKALGRVLARDLKARRDQPPFAASAMDGYAVRHADIVQVPATLRIIGMSAAGHGFRGQVAQGEAIRIFTGAPLPKGADTIVIQENTEADGQRVTVLSPARKGQSVRVRGLDFTRGGVVLPSGQCLNARDIGLAAALGYADVPMRRRPRIAILATGDELVVPGTPPRWDQIYSSNSTALAAFVERFGGIAHDLGVVPDTLPATMRAIKRAAHFDVLLTTGGASVGDHDYVHAALHQSGVKVGFWKIAMRPGKPLMFGRKGALRVIGLPGNPVSALVCSRLFLKPLLDGYLGRPAETPYVPAVLALPMAENDGRQNYVRAKLHRAADGTLLAEPCNIQDSSMQRTLREADALIVRKPHATAADKGDLVDVMLLDF